MIYLTGTANNLTDLLTALTSSLSANGYTWDSTNSLLSKGAVASKLTIVGTGTAQVLQMQAGTGVSGGALQNPAVNTPGIRAGLMGLNKVTNIVFPVTYKIFIYTSPDMWVLSVNHDSVYWQHMMNGLAVNLGLTGLSGVLPFFYASFKFGQGSNHNLCCLNSSANGSTGSGACSGALPFLINNTLGSQHDNCGVFANEPLAFNGSAAVTWAPNYLSSASQYSTNTQVNWQLSSPMTAYQTINRLPNAWNQDSQLVPLRTLIGRPSGFLSPACLIPHLRLVRNDFYNDGDIQTYGTDQWMILPARRKDSVNRTIAASGGADASGTYALALEYTP